jgi:molybdenum cofactor biosynthesis enzyme MoaA
MKIQTFSIVVGGNKCNATCPYCVSKMTGETTCSDKLEEVNFRNFEKACQFAKMSGVSTVLLTGKGEPLLYLKHITNYLQVMYSYNFPFIELQTNGIDLPKISKQLFKQWYNLGLTTISLSCAHWTGDKNRAVFGKRYNDLKYYIDLIHAQEFSVRVSCVMLDDMIDDVARVKYFAKRCKEWGVEQFTIRPVCNDVTITAEDRDNNSTKYKIYKWIEKHKLSRDRTEEIEKYFENEATLLLELVHGAKVYDYKGQNISINTCLTSSTDPDNTRQLIFSPDGHLRYSWSYRGAILL